MSLSICTGPDSVPQGILTCGMLEVPCRSHYAWLGSPWELVQNGEWLRLSQPLGLSCVTHIHRRIRVVGPHTKCPHTCCDACCCCCRCGSMFWITIPVYINRITDVFSPMFTHLYLESAGSISLADISRWCAVYFWILESKPSFGKCKILPTLSDPGAGCSESSLDLP